MRGKTSEDEDENEEEGKGDKSARPGVKTSEDEEEGKGVVTLLLRGWWALGLNYETVDFHLGRGGGDADVGRVCDEA